MANTYAPERGQFGETIYAMSAPYTQISNSTVETLLVPDFTLPANHFGPGRSVRGYISGVCSNVVTTPGTLTYHVHLGPLTLSATADVASGALGLDTTARTNFGFALNFLVTCNTNGSGGTAFVTGEVRQANVLSSTAANLLPNLIPQSGNATVTVDTTVANILGVSAKFSVATSPTNITAQTYILESLN